MIQRLAEEQRLSGAVVHGGLVWLAGQVADDASLDAEFFFKPERETAPMVTRSAPILRATAAMPATGSRSTRCRRAGGTFMPLANSVKLSRALAFCAS